VAGVTWVVKTEERPGDWYYAADESGLYITCRQRAAWRFARREVAHHAADGMRGKVVRLVKKGKP
jgi:hypothetical protein